MSRIHVNRFLGIAPKVNETLLNPSQAQISNNARLWSQALNPLDGALLGSQLSKTGDIQTIHRYANDTVWLEWTEDVNAVLGPAANDTLEKLYFTGTDKPRVTTNAKYDDVAAASRPDSWILGIPAPVGPPVATDNIASAIGQCRTWDGAAFTNENTDINDVGANDVPLFLDPNDAIYFGDAAKFNALRINVGTAGTGGVVAWEYWNGSAWVALTGLTDGTNAFQNAGTVDVKWTQPADWATTAVDGSTVFWVRARVTTLLVGTPNLTQAFLSAAGNLTGNETWVYTFVRKYSDGWVEESAPSPVSNTLTLAARQASVTMPNGAITIADYGITHKRLYRSEGGSFFFVAEITEGTASTTDNVATASLGDAIETTNDLPPPDGMKGLIALPNNCLAGFKDNVVYISEPNRPHAYPLLNQYTMSYPVVGLGAVGTVIVVATEGKPEIGRGVDPAAYSFKANPGIFPCTSKRSIASSELGVFWSTPRGIALSDGVSVSIATEEFVSRIEWQDFAPDTIHAAVHDGRYYGWFSTGVDSNGFKIGGGFILDRLDPAFLTTVGEYVYAAHTIEAEDELHVVKKISSTVSFTYTWDADPSAPLAYDWKSKVFITSGMENLGAAQIIGHYDQGLSAEEIADLLAAIAAAEAYNDALASTDGPVNDLDVNGGPVGGDNTLLPVPSIDFVAGSVTFTYWADGVLVLTRDVTNSQPFPLPSGFLAEKHEFQVSGSVEVDQITLAGTPEELGTV